MKAALIALFLLILLTAVAYFSPSSLPQTLDLTWPYPTREASPTVNVALIMKFKSNPDEYQFIEYLAEGIDNDGSYKAQIPSKIDVFPRYVEIHCRETTEACSAYLIPLD